MLSSQILQILRLIISIVVLCDMKINFNSFNIAILGALIFVGPLFLILASQSKLSNDENKLYYGINSEHNIVTEAEKSPEIFYYDDVIIEFATKKITEINSYNFHNIKNTIKNIQKYMLPATFKDYFSSIGGDKFIESIRREKQYSLGIALPADTKIVAVSDNEAKKEWQVYSSYSKVIKYKNRKPRYLQKNVLMYIVMPRHGRFSGKLLISGIVDLNN